MELITASHDPSRGWSRPLSALAAADGPRTLVPAFGPATLADDPRPLADLARELPSGRLIGCSTGGAIRGDKVNDAGLVVAVAKFAHTELTTAAATVGGPVDSFTAGRSVAARLASPALRAVLVTADGLMVHGSDLVRGINAGLADVGHPVPVSGGMAGDGQLYRRTWTVGGDDGGGADAVPHGGRVVAVGLSGCHLRVGHGSAGGFHLFGPERRITRATGRVVHESDGQPALALYKRYLGDRAAGLPATALLFPMVIRPGAGAEHRLVRTVLAVDEAGQSLLLGGDVPQGWCGQLLRAGVDRLVDGAMAAAADAFAGWGSGTASDGPTLSLAVSCSGRRLVMGERIGEELEAVAAVAPAGGGQVGFYAYGEICPLARGGGPAELHNRTMTVTRFTEAA